MNIGYIHLDYGEWTNGSYNSQEIGLAKALEQMGHQTTIVYWVSSKDERCNTKVNITPNIKKVYLPYRMRLVHHIWPNLSLLSSLNIDIYHLQSDNLLCVPEAVNFCLNHGWKHYCYVGTVHSSSPKAISRWIMDKLSNRNFTAFRKTKVFCKTPAVVNELKLKGVTSAEWAPVGLDTDIIPPTIKPKSLLKNELGLPHNKIIIFLVCALRPDKHPMDIFPLGEVLGDKYLLVHAGTPWIQTEEYMKKLKSNDIYSNILFVGKIPNEKVHAYYEVADYVINFNPNEIFGMAILEAMYHNVTVVARHAPGPDCIIENGESGFLCSSVEEMAQIIHSGKKVQNARKRIIEYFTWESTAKKFLDYIQH